MLGGEVGFKNLLHGMGANSSRIVFNFDDRVVFSIDKLDMDSRMGNLPGDEGVFGVGEDVKHHLGVFIGVAIGDAIPSFSKLKDDIVIA